MTHPLTATDEQIAALLLTCERALDEQRVDDARGLIGQASEELCAAIAREGGREELYAANRRLEALAVRGMELEGLSS